MAAFGAIQELIWTKGGVGRNWFRLYWSDDFAYGQPECDGIRKEPDTPQKASTYTHIDIKYHWLREHTYESGTVGLAHCRTENMVADVMTKALDSKLHNKHAVNISGFGDV